MWWRERQQSVDRVLRSHGLEGGSADGESARDAAPAALEGRLAPPLPRFGLHERPAVTDLGIQVGPSSGPVAAPCVKFSA